MNIAPFFANQPADFAVTGGTGTFRVARGTVTIQILSVPASGTAGITWRLAEIVFQELHVAASALARLLGLA